jgi:hypothetical protein
LLEGERRRFEVRLTSAEIDDEAGAVLRAAVQDVEDAR